MQQNFFTELISLRNGKKKNILMNKLAYLFFSDLEISKILMYLFWYDYVKSKYGKNPKYVTWKQAAS